MAAAAASAATSSLPNLFSFFTTPPPKSPPSHLSLCAAAAGSNDEVMAVVCPSVAHANTLFFRSGYNVQVIVDDNEPEERLLGRFRREVMRAGVIQECKRRRFFENKQEEKKKRKVREAAKRNRRRRPQLRNAPPERAEGQRRRVKKIQITGSFLKEASPNSLPLLHSFSI